jgi:hypothetical protein
MIHVHGACGAETCYIDDSPLLLYKTINWWYDSLPEESSMLCGKPIKCINEGNARVEYDEAKMKINIKIERGLASMLSVFKKCVSCYGPTHLHNLSINPDYFMNSKTILAPDDSSTINRFRFNNINKERAQLLKSIEKDLVFVVEGVIGGLYNGQITLHESGALLKHCRGPFFGKYDNYPICIKIIDARNKKILAEYTMHWE